MARMVILKNMVDAQISVKDPSVGINRKWQRRGQSLPIPYEQVEQLLWTDGFRRMIDQGVLYIENMKDKQDLGLEPMEATKPENIIALSEQQIKSLLTETPITVFKKEISQLPDTQIDSVIDYAINHEIVDSVKCQILKDVTKRDILGAISRKHKAEEEDKLEAQRRAARTVEGRR